MLIDTTATIAYKCPSCGTFEFFSLSIFMLAHRKENRLGCRCGGSDIAIAREDSNSLRIEIPCNSCGDNHTYNFDMNRVFHGGISTFCCPRTGLQQCFAGRDDGVRKGVDSLERELDAIIDMFGYESYFLNTQVMLDALNKVHDIAEKGNLCCECGCRDIGLILLPDRIYLNCKKCPGERIISAASNHDLKHILGARQIILSENSAHYDTIKPVCLAGENDGK